MPFAFVAAKMEASNSSLSVAVLTSRTCSCVKIFSVIFGDNVFLFFLFCQCPFGES